MQYSFYLTYGALERSVESFVGALCCPGLEDNQLQELEGIIVELSVAIVVDSLCDYRKTCAKAAIIAIILQQTQSDSLGRQYDHAELEKRYNELLLKKGIIECWIQLLPDDERFLIQTHMIQGLDWAKTIAEYDKRWGPMNGRSERSLKRTQARAIKRIVECMNEIEVLTIPDPEKKNGRANEASFLAPK